MLFSWFRQMRTEFWALRPLRRSYSNCQIDVFLWILILEHGFVEQESENDKRLLICGFFLFPGVTVYSVALVLDLVLSTSRCVSVPDCSANLLSDPLLQVNLEFILTSGFLRFREGDNLLWFTYLLGVRGKAQLFKLSDEGDLQYRWWRPQKNCVVDFTFEMSWLTVQCF